VGDLQRLIAFDLDGTLIDSRRDLAESANELVVEFGGAPLSEEAIGGMVGEGAALLVRRALASAGIAQPPSALARFLEIYGTRLLNHTRMYDGIERVVRGAREHAHLAVLTNKPTSPTERLLRAFGLRDLFDEVVGGDSPYPRKPDPAGLMALMKSTGAGADCTLLVGDSPIDAETARRASVRCCIVSYGFGFSVFPRERPAEVGCVVHDTEALGAAIDRFAAGQ
jgi:phosphoglycolate phosphatase